MIQSIQLRILIKEWQKTKTKTNVQDRIQTGITRYTLAKIPLYASLNPGTTHLGTYCTLVRRFHP